MSDPTTPNIGLPLETRGYLRFRESYKAAMAKIATQTGLTLPVFTDGHAHFKRNFYSNLAIIGAALGLTVPTTSLGAMQMKRQYVAVMSTIDTSVNAGAAKIDIFGDSISNQNWENSTTTQAKGFAVQAISRVSGRGRIGQNFGVSGNTTVQMLARIADVIASPNPYVVVLGGTNDLAAATPRTATQIIDTLIGTEGTPGIVRQLVLAGKTVFLCTIMPRSFWAALTSPQITAARQYRLDVNAAIMALAGVTLPGTGRVYVADTATPLTDSGSGTQDPIANTFPDGLHPNAYGAALAGVALAETLNTNLPTFVSDVPRPLLDYNATSNPTGALTANPMMVTAGGSTGSGVTGAVAQGYTLARSAGTVMTAVSALVAGGMQVTLGGGGAGSATENIRLALADLLQSGGRYAAGDTVYLEAEFDFTGLSGVQAIYTQMTVNDGTTSLSYYGSRISTGVTADRELASGSKFIRTIPIVIPANAGATPKINAYLHISAQGNDAAIAGVVTIKRVALRKLV